MHKCWKAFLLPLAEQGSTTLRTVWVWRVGLGRLKKKMRHVEGVDPAVCYSCVNCKSFPQLLQHPSRSHTTSTCQSSSRCWDTQEIPKKCFHYWRASRSIPAQQITLAECLKESFPFPALRHCGPENLSTQKVSQRTVRKFILTRHSYPWRRKTRHSTPLPTSEALALRKTTNNWWDRDFHADPTQHLNAEALAQHKTCQKKCSATCVTGNSTLCPN